MIWRLWFSTRYERSRLTSDPRSARRDCRGTVSHSTWSPKQGELLLVDRSPSVRSLTDDSQIGGKLRVCADEENRADCDQHGRSRTIVAAVRDRNTPRKVGLASTDRAAGERCGSEDTWPEPTIRLQEIP